MIPSASNNVQSLRDIGIDRNFNIWWWRLEYCSPLAVFDVSLWSLCSPKYDQQHTKSDIALEIEALLDDLIGRWTILFHQQSITTNLILTLFYEYYHVIEVSWSIFPSCVDNRWGGWMIVNMCLLHRRTRVWDRAEMQWNEIQSLSLLWPISPPHILQGNVDCALRVNVLFLSAAGALVDTAVLAVVSEDGAL